MGSRGSITTWPSSTTGCGCWRATHESGNRNDVWYSADGVNWHEVPNTPWKPRHAASVFVHDDALWMVAGNNMESDVWKLQRRVR